MADNYQNNSNRTRVSISTNMFTLWDSNGIQLRVSGMDNGLSIGIWVPFFNQDGSRKYPAERRHAIILSQRNTLALEKIIYDYIVPAYASGNDCSKSIFTNAAKTTILEIETRNGEMFLYLHHNCDPTTHIPQDTIVFKFDTLMVIDKYDRVTGEIEAAPVQADFYIFAKAIRAYNDLVGGSVSAHGNKIATSFRNQQLMDYLRAIATAVHAQLPAPVYQNAGGYQNPPQNGVQHTYNAEDPRVANTLPTPQTIEVNNITDLLG